MSRAPTRSTFVNMSSIRYHPYSSAATHARTSSAAIVTTSSISAATTSVVAALTSTRPFIRADGALQPSHPLSPTLGFICTALTGIKSSLDELRKEQSSLKKEFNEFVISSFSIESSAYKVTN